MNVLVNDIRRLAQQKTAPNGRKYLSLSTKATCQIASRNNQTLKDSEIHALKNGVIPERYQRNMGTVGIEGQIKLLQSQVAVVGVGGLGGTVLELLVRLGIGRMVVIDGDAFVDSNLNRQFLSQFESIGEPKVEAAKRRARDVNPATEIETYPVVAREEDLPEMIKGSHVVVDGLDDIRARFSLERVSKKMGIPFVHGAIAGFVGQVTTVFPEDKGLELVYGPGCLSKSGVEKDFGTPCLTPALVATWQVSEVIKILLELGNTLRNRVLVVDLMEQVMEVVPLS